MARKRGFFAELSHQAAVAEKNRQRSQAAAVRDQARLQRESERLQLQLERAERRESIMTEKEQKQLHIEAQEAEVERLNGELALQLSEVDEVLSATLDVDDYVDVDVYGKPSNFLTFYRQTGIRYSLPHRFSCRRSRNMSSQLRRAVLGQCLVGRNVMRRL